MSKYDSRLLEPWPSKRISGGVPAGLPSGEIHFGCAPAGNRPSSAVPPGAETRSPLAPEALSAEPGRISPDPNEKNGPIA